MSEAARLLLRRRSWWINLRLDVKRGYHVLPEALIEAEFRLREQAAYVIGFLA